jgi:hypothetical protein
MNKHPHWQGKRNVFVILTSLCVEGLPISHSQAPPSSLHVFQATEFDLPVYNAPLEGPPLRQHPKVHVVGLTSLCFLCSMHQTAQLFKGRLWRTAGEAGVIFPPSCSDTSSICLLRLLVLRLAGEESPLADAGLEGPIRWQSEAPLGAGLCLPMRVGRPRGLFTRVDIFSVFELRCCLVPV